MSTVALVGVATVTEDFSHLLRLVVNIRQQRLEGIRQGFAGTVADEVKRRLVVGFPFHVDKVELDIWKNRLNNNKQVLVTIL